jgi:hypothetical protein
LLLLPKDIKKDKGLDLLFPTGKKKKVKKYVQKKKQKKSARIFSVFETKGKNN